MSTMTDPINEQAIAQRITNARRLAGLTKRAAAIRLDVTEKTISRWESAETSGFLEHLDAIAAAYGVTADQLLGEDVSRESVGDATAVRLAAVERELAELRALLLDPARLRAAAEALIRDEDEGV